MRFSSFPHPKRDEQQSEEQGSLVRIAICKTCDDDHGSWAKHVKSDVYLFEDPIFRTQALIIMF